VVDLKVFLMVICMIIFFFLFILLAYSQSENTEQANIDKGKLEIWFRITSAPMTEREIYYQVCKLYIDDKEMGISPFINKVNKWFLLFSVDLDDGIYNVKIIHGFANKEGKWANEFNKQPKTFRVGAIKGPSTIIKYSYNVGLLKDDYVYDKVPTPPRILPLKIPPKNKPRIMVVIPEYYSSKYIPDPSAETSIIKKLVENDFLVVDQAQVQKIRDKDESKRALEGDSNAAVAIGRQYNAEILIIGEAFGEITEIFPQNLTTNCSARVEAKAIRVDTGQILATYGTTASASGNSDEIAAKNALAIAGDEMGDYLMRQIVRKWSSEPAPSVIIKLANVDFRQLILFEQTLRDRVEGVQSFHRRSFDVVGKVAEIDTSVSGGSQSFSTRLATIEFPDFEIEVMNFTMNTLDLRLKPKASTPADLALRLKSVIVMEQTKPDGTEKTKVKIMVIKNDEFNLEYDWVVDTPGSISYSGTYVIDSFDKSHEYEAGWETKSKESPKGTYPWVSREVLRELRDSGFTNIIVDRTIRKDTIVMAELKDATIFPVEINGKKTDVKAMLVTTDKGDKLLMLDELQNPLVLSADIAGRYKTKVTTIYIPGYKAQKP
jgi:hypothetical protein